MRKVYIDGVGMYANNIDLSLSTQKMVELFATPQSNLAVIPICCCFNSCRKELDIYP